MLSLRVLSGTYVICRLGRDYSLPLSILSIISISSGEEIRRPKDLFSVSYTEDECSIVCEESFALEGLLGVTLQCEKNWRALKVQGPLDFSLCGVLASILQPLTQAKIPVFVLSTFDTDYILVKQEVLLPAVGALKDNGFLVVKDME